jgi:hypothetical protein
VIQIFVYLAIAAALAFGVHKAWSGFKDSIGAPYAQAQIAKDAPILKKAQDDATEALAERDHAKADTSQCLAAAQTQTDMVDLWQARAKANAAAAQAARAQAQKDATAAAPRIADLQARAAAAPKLLACQDELASANKVIDDSLRARRGMKPAGAK